MKRRSMTSGSTMFARIVIYLVGISALAVLVILLPELSREEAVGKPTDLTVPVLTVAYILATPFFIALHFALKLLRNIDKNKVFSNESIAILRNIKYCAIVFTILFVIAISGGISYLKSIEPTEDVAPFFSLGFIIAFVSSIIVVFIAVLQKLLADAVAMKSENDLIV